MTEKIIVIGGGFAGLSAGTALAERGYQVTLLEGRQVLGGRAYSFPDRKTGDAVDNGQHLFMSCYDHTRKFLNRIGTGSAIDFQPNLAVDFVNTLGMPAKLRCWPLPAPWHLLSGLMRLSSLSWADRFRLLRMQTALREAALHPDAVEKLTVTQWLTQWKQSTRAQHNFWDLIAIATLNEDPAIASAAPFVTVLSQAFFQGRERSQLGFAAVGLSDLYASASRGYIENHGGEVWLKAPVERLLLRDGRVEGVQLREGMKL